MKRSTAVLLAACLTVGALAPTATGALTHHGWSHRILHDFYSVRRALGVRAAGRDIIRRGVRTRHGVRPATKSEKARFQRQLRALLHPPAPLLARTAVLPTQPPAGVRSAGIMVGSSHMACIIRAESHGDPGAVNGQYEGIGQWSSSSWSRWGGTRYASHPTAATYQQQLTVLASEGDGGMTQEQGQYDGCG